MIGQPKICIDFDGVIHDNWKFIRPHIINGSPVEGALEAIKSLSERYDVIVHSTRCNGDAGLKAVTEWLEQHGFLKYARVVNYKPVAVIYIDDRAIRFDGDWDETMKNITKFTQWQDYEKERRRHGPNYVRV